MFHHCLFAIYSSITWFQISHFCTLWTKEPVINSTLSSWKYHGSASVWHIWLIHLHQCLWHQKHIKTVFNVFSWLWGICLRKCKIILFLTLNHKQLIPHLSQPLICTDYSSFLEILYLYVSELTIINLLCRRTQPWAINKWLPFYNFWGFVDLINVRTRFVNRWV